MTTTTTRLTIAWTSITVQPEPLHIDAREALVQQADACVRIGTAPDGLPLLLRVHRSASVVEPVLRALGVGDVKQLSPELKQMVQTMNRRVQHECRHIGIVAHAGEGHAPSYITSNDVGSMFGRPLLSRLLGTLSPMLLPDERSTGGGHADEIAAKTSVGVLMSADARVALAQMVAQRQQLVVPLDDGDVQVVRRGEGRTLEAGSARPLVQEDLCALRSATFHCVKRVDGTHEVTRLSGRLGDQRRYLEALAGAHAVGWSVTRDDLLQVIVDVARSLAPMHAAGRVHADIKPDNILLTTHGAVAHDAVDVEAGTLCAVGTRGWNAPEQIVAQPVSPATDVFALAQLVVLVLEGAIFGEERSVIVPIGNGARIRERLLGNPDVYLDPTQVPMDDDAIAAWRAFLRRCLALDPRDRLPDATAFADALAELARRHPVSGRRCVSGLVGSLARTRSDGVDGAAWVLHDHNAALWATPWSVLQNDVDIADDAGIDVDDAA